MQPITTPRDPRPRLRRLLGVTAALGAALLLGGQAATAHVGLMGRGPLPPDVRGTYRTDDGQVLTFTGGLGMPSYEVDGMRVTLRAVDDDRWVAYDEHAEGFSIERDARGRVRGVALERPGQPSLRARPTTLYREQDVRFANGDVTLVGAIALPLGPGPFPAVAIVHGAAPATRESYRLIASHFARRGVAALVYDKRGVGESGGDVRRATFDDLTGDALAAVDVLRRHPDVRRDAVGLMGLSQGGWVIAMAAARSEDVAFLIPVGASGFSPAVQDRWLNGNILAHRELDPRANRASEQAWRMMLSSRDLVDAGLMPAMPDVMGFWFHALDPDLDSAALWESVRQPVLGIWGELDCQVPAHDSLRHVRAALERGGNDRYRLVIVPGADHSITIVGACAQEATGWSVTRWAYPDDYFPMMADWVAGLPGSAVSEQRVVLPATRTPSMLGWHQAAERGVPWYGSFAPQVGLMLGLLALFSGLVVVSVVGRLVALVRRRGHGRAMRVGPVALVGLAATLAAVMALAELLVLGSIEGGLLLGGGLVLGLPPLFVAAGVLTALAAGLGVALVARRVLEARRAGLRIAVSTREGLLLVALTLLVGWVGYWGMLPSLPIG
jgi:uncharacterized protein